MTEEDRVDLSALDPANDANRWQAILESTRLRAEVVVARRAEDPLWTIAAWSRPILIAVAVALALLIPVELALEAREPRVEQVERLVDLSTDLAAASAPSGADFLRALAAGER